MWGKLIHVMDTSVDIALMRTTQIHVERVPSLSRVLALYSILNLCEETELLE